MKRRVIIVIILLLFLLSACGNSMNKTEQESSSEPEKTMATEQEGGLPTAETESAFPEDPQAYLDELRGRYPDAICAVTINPSRKGDIYVIDLDLDRPETASAAAEIRRAFGDRALLVWTSSLGLTTGTPEDLKRMHRD